MNCRAYAKALHYKEEEFHRGLTTNTLESLISINNKLQQPDAAAGVLVFAQKKAEGEFVSLSLQSLLNTGSGLQWRVFLRSSLRSLRFVA